MKLPIHLGRRLSSKHTSTPGSSPAKRIHVLLDGAEDRAGPGDPTAVRLLRDLAKRSPAAINYFANELARWDGLPKNAVLCVVPPLHPGPVASGIRQTALRLCELGERDDGTHCLTRIRPFACRDGEHPEAALLRQLATLAVRDSALLLDRQVVLLTDQNRGSSYALRAGEMLLLKAGAVEVIKCALTSEAPSALPLMPS